MSRDYIYSAVEAARYAGVSRAQFYRMRKSGIIVAYARPTYRGTIRVCYRKSELDLLRCPRPFTLQTPAEYRK